MLSATPDSMVSPVEEPHSRASSSSQSLAESRWTLPGWLTTIAWSIGPQNWLEDQDGRATQTP